MRAGDALYVAQVTEFDVQLLQWDALLREWSLVNQWQVPSNTNTGAGGGPGASETVAADGGSRVLTVHL